MRTYCQLVSVLTPVFNGDKYLSECIESVRSQQYDNWEYIIVNNCSTDSSLEIASRVADVDSRIRVISNPKFVGAIDNHNIALSLISSESKYCKIVSADDQITSDCLTKMVIVAEAHPSTSIVGSYQLSNNNVRWKGLPQHQEVISGREVCRLTLFDKLDVFGNPTSSLYRSDLVRNNNPFFPHSLPHADTSACFKYLQHSDFGFVHEILSIQRVHDHQISSPLRSRNAGDVASFELLLEYGPIYLSDEEIEKRKIEFLERYYKFLGGSILKLKDQEFWKYHVSRMRELKYPISWNRVIRGVIAELIDEIQNPKVAIHKVLTVLKNKYCNML